MREGRKGGQRRMENGYEKVSCTVRWGSRRKWGREGREVRKPGSSLRLREENNREKTRLSQRSNSYTATATARRHRFSYFWGRQAKRPNQQSRRFKRCPFQTSRDNLCEKWMNWVGVGWPSAIFLAVSFCDVMTNVRARGVNIDRHFLFQRMWGSEGRWRCLWDLRRREKGREKGHKMGKDFYKVGSQ